MIHYFMENSAMLERYFKANMYFPKFALKDEHFEIKLGFSITINSIYIMKHFTLEKNTMIFQKISCYMKLYRFGYGDYI